MHLSEQELLSIIGSPERAETQLFVAKNRCHHLSDCDQCQQRLGQLSGEGDWLREVSDAVKFASETVVETGGYGSSRICSVVTRVDSLPNSKHAISVDEVDLSFLDAPRHPELLGRLDRYDLERLVGVGGQGVVFKAWDTDLNRMVAIKVLAPHLLRNNVAKKRFVREGRASAAIVNDHVVAIHDVVVGPDCCYMVMQFIQGESLQQRVLREGPLSPCEVLRVAIQVAAGLSEAHQQGLVHRDIKPANILLEGSAVGRAFVSDFGLALAQDDEGLTCTGTISGTPQYMSPEQAKGGSVGVASDIFSLASTIYFMSCGHSPFEASTMVSTLVKIYQDKHVRLEELSPESPRDLCDLLDRMLVKTAASRIGSAAEVKKELEWILADYRSEGVTYKRRQKALSRSRKIIAIAILAFIVISGSAWLGYNGNLPWQSVALQEQDVQWDAPNTFAQVALLYAVEHRNLDLELVSEQQQAISRIKKLDAYQQDKLMLKMEQLVKEKGMSLMEIEFSEGQLTPQQITLMNEIRKLEFAHTQAINGKVFDVLLPFQQEILGKYVLGQELRAGLFDCLLYGTIGPRLLSDDQQVELVQKSRDEFLSDIRLGVSDIVEKAIEKNFGKAVEILERKAASRTEIAPFFRKLRPADLGRPQVMDVVMSHFSFSKSAVKGGQFVRVTTLNLLNQCVKELSNEFSSQQLVAIDEWISENFDRLLGDEREEAWLQLEKIISNQQNEKLLRLLVRKEFESFGFFHAATKGVVLRQFLDDDQWEDISKLGTLIVDQTHDETSQVIQDSYEKHSKRILDELSDEAASSLKEQLAGMEYHKRHSPISWMVAITSVEK